MRVSTLCFLLFAVSAFTPHLSAQEPSVDEFLPVLEGGPSEVKEPSAVSVDDSADTVEAATAQDAINAAVAKNKSELADGETDSAKPEVGTTLVKFPSGLGVVATGIGSYRVVENPVATRISQRQATLKAFVEAKKGLAEYLNGLSNESKDTIREYLSNVETTDESLTNLEVSSDSTLKQMAEMMLRGFVVYELYDDPANHRIYLSIVTTPKTRGELARPAPNHVEAESLRAGIASVLTEVKTGLIAPVGGKIVTVPSTGETAFVGFGSSVVRANESEAVQAKLNLNSQKIAAAFAQDSLCGLIVGDETVWQGEIQESYKDEHREFEEIEKGDPLNPDAQGRRKLEATREEFVSTIKTTDVYASARRGVLPPGVTVRTWFDEDHAWAHGIAVYIPSATNVAAGIRRDIDAAKIIQDIQPNGSGANDGGVNREGEGNKPQQKVKPLPSGKINKDDL